MIQLKKIGRGKFYDKVSSRCIYKVGSKWRVMNECTAYVYFSAATLKECKMFQKRENEIASWND